MSKRQVSNWHAVDGDAQLKRPFSGVLFFCLAPFRPCELGHTLHPLLQCLALRVPFAWHEGDGGGHLLTNLANRAKKTLPFRIIPQVSNKGQDKKGSGSVFFGPFFSVVEKQFGELR